MRHLMVLVIASALVGLQAQAKTVRASELIQQGMTDFSKIEQGTVVEFRQGDQLPVSFQAEGDLIETTRSEVSYVGVKKNFWVQLENNDLMMSFDGVNYKKVQDLLTGAFSVGAGSAENGGVADAINMKFTAKLK